MIDPKIIKNVLSKDSIEKIIQAVEDPKKLEYQNGFSRYVAADNKLKILKSVSESLVPIAKKIFNSETLMPTYTLFSHYEGDNPKPSLYKHKDDNACTYTIDLCLYQTIPWDLYVEEKPYTLYQNEALAYYGNDQMHWRQEFPGLKDDHVAMIFFHFAEPDHWYFTEGPNYLYTHIRK